MPKRSNPFGDCSPLQLKSHIGQKEVDLGVNKAQNMQRVYEKTTAMLFQGARKSPLMSSDMEMEDSDNTAVPVQGQLSPEMSKGQQRLDKMGYVKNSPDMCVTMDLAEEECVIVTSERGQASFAQNRKQMCFGPGGLLRPCSSNGVSVLPSEGSCQTCQQKKPRGMARCQFCDKVTCQPCSRTCCFCSGTYCHLCSVLNYDECFERSVCLQCQGK